jgi:AcrR family transcriptional regulator
VPQRGQQRARCGGRRSGGAESGGEFPGAAEHAGAGDRVHVVVVADDLAAAHPDDAQSGELVGRAGVGPGTVYRHFPTKEELFEAVVTARVRDLVDDARDLVDDARGRADDADPGQAFFGFLGKIRQEAAAKRDLPEAIALAGPLQDDLHAALDALLRRARQAGAVRPEITTPDIIILLKGLLRSINDAPPGAASQARTDRLLAVVADGLRPRP